MAKRNRARQAALVALYRDYLHDQDSAAFIRRTAELYTIGTLERLAAHPRREARRAAVLALGFLGDFDSNAVLGRGLSDKDRTVRMLSETGIRNLWLRAGNDAQRQQLSVIVQLNLSQRYSEAVLRATELIEEAPAFSEAWNQRAIARYNDGRYWESIHDCHQALELNPYHFGAAAGMGQAYLQLGQRQNALDCFRRALRLNPGLEGIRAGISYLERSLRNERRNEKKG